MLDGVGRTFVQAWRAYHAMTERETLSERGSPAAKAVRQRPASKSDPSLPLVRQEMLDQIRAVVDNLNARDRKVVRLYYGFDGEPLTLKEIGIRLHLTRERIRQILNDNYARLKDRLDIVPEDLQALL
jgi:RNA polymerase sigma factor (sigma-70 family)